VKHDQFNAEPVFALTNQLPPTCGMKRLGEKIKNVNGRAWKGAEIKRIKL